MLYSTIAQFLFVALASADQFYDPVYGSVSTAITVSLPSLAAPTTPCSTISISTSTYLPSTTIAILPPPTSTTIILSIVSTPSSPLLIVATTASAPVLIQPAVVPSSLACINGTQVGGGIAYYNGILCSTPSVISVPTSSPSASSPSTTLFPTLPTIFSPAVGGASATPIPPVAFTPTNGSATAIVTAASFPSATGFYQPTINAAPAASIQGVWSSVAVVVALAAVAMF